MAATSVCIDSHALASLLTDAAAASGDCDGLLFGRECVQRTHSISDETDVPVEREERYVRITSVLCTTRLCSFYDAAGAFDEAAFARLASASDGAGVVGWLVARRATPLWPSQREAAVWRALRQQLCALASPLFAVVSGEQPLTGEPFSSQYVVFAAPGGADEGLQPQPLPCTILNYGRGAPPRTAASGAAHAPLDEPRWHPLMDGGAADGEPWLALERAATASAASTRAAFDAALERATALCLDLERAEDELHARRVTVREAHEREQRELDAAQAERERLPPPPPPPPPPPENLPEEERPAEMLAESELDSLQLSEDDAEAAQYLSLLDAPLDSLDAPARASAPSIFDELQ